VVNRVRRALGERRVGHGGTLDPAASGVLVVGVGQAARLLGMLTLDDKRYDACVRFGAETSTDDAEGEVTRRAEVPARLAEAPVAAAVVASLAGTCEQVPPAYSAISVDGRRSYARARAGEAVELPSRTVTIYESELKDVSFQEGDLTWDMALHVSKGTYVRSIARDLGRSMGTAAHLAGLRRTASGPVGIDACHSLDKIEHAGAAGVQELALDPVRALCLPRYELDAEGLERLRVGRRIRPQGPAEEDGRRRELVQGDRVALVHEGRLMGVWECTDGLLACVCTFLNGVTGVRP
jgi:tRNA pseudouridine55 synthase